MTGVYSFFQYGVKFIRGCEIEGLLDEDGNVIEEGKYIFKQNI